MTVLLMHRSVRHKRTKRKQYFLQTGNQVNEWLIQKMKLKLVIDLWQTFGIQETAAEFFTFSEVGGTGCLLI